jgi:hypothetical protein
VLRVARPRSRQGCERRPPAGAQGDDPRSQDIQRIDGEPAGPPGGRAARDARDVPFITRNVLQMRGSSGARGGYQYAGGEG